MLGCYRYIELNPLRAGMVEHPGDYRWSSYRANAHGEGCDWLAPHGCYRALAADNQGRPAAYRSLFRYHLDPGLVDRIRAATNSNYALGSGRFEEEVAKALGRREVWGRSGRPKRRRDAVTGDLQRPER